MKFFIPHLTDDPDAAEAEWLRYLRESLAPADSRRVRRVNYTHEGARYEVAIGQRRTKFARKTGPRGGHLKTEEYQGFGSETGTVVSGIIDAGEIIYVWSYGPPFGGWANPSFVGRSSITDIEYFD